MCPWRVRLECRDEHDAPARLVPGPLRPARRALVGRDRLDRTPALTRASTPQQPYAQPQFTPSTPTVPLGTGVSGGSGRAKAIALVAAAVVLVAAIVTGAVVLSGDDGTRRRRPRRRPRRPRPRAPSPPPSPSESSSEPSADDPSVVVDELNGITLPLLDGWARPENVIEDDVVMTTSGTYDCPGDHGLCRHGTGHLAHGHRERREVPGDPRQGRHLRGGRPRLRPQHRQPAPLPRHHLPRGGRRRARSPSPGAPGTSCAGASRPRRGPEVTSSRWRSRPASARSRWSSSGTPSTRARRGRPSSDMDRITKGIRPVGDEGTGGGVGSSIGPPVAAGSHGPDRHRCSRRQRNVWPSPRYVGTVAVTASPSTRCSASNRSHSSPALACRNHTLSPISRSSAGEPSSGVCTSPAPSWGSYRSPSGQVRHGQPVGTRGTRRRVAAAEDGHDTHARPADDGLGEERGRTPAERRVVVEEPRLRTAPTPPRSRSPRPRPPCAARCPCRRR